MLFTQRIVLTLSEVQQAQTDASRKSLQDAPLMSMSMLPCRDIKRTCFSNAAEKCNVQRPTAAVSCMNNAGVKDPGSLTPAYQTEAHHSVT